VGFLNKFKNNLNKIIAISVGDSLSVLFSKKHLLRWSDDKFNKKNFGDALNPELFSKISGGEVVSAGNVLNLINRPVFCFIGSILDNIKQKNAIICGAGFQRKESFLKRAPKAILAVRGPLSRNIILKQGYDCPEVYCDPALLLPFYYPKDKTNRLYNVGIIAHYADKALLDKSNIVSGNLTYSIIDIEDDIDSVIDKICEVDCVLSSSLHGLIVAHAYGIPATWLKLSDNVIGGDFKFRDYYYSVGADDVPTYSPSKTIELKKGVEIATVYETANNARLLLNKFEEYFQKEIKHELRGAE
jgi:pyruvyltransferase